jgi:hypothetical protein
MHPIRVKDAPGRKKVCTNCDLFFVADDAGGNE